MYCRMYDPWLVGYWIARGVGLGFENIKELDTGYARK